eukprot:CAMPEP_0184861772 /NCGR_PEP_ID=MMETSP0580-20130426/6376_1 /TAXON_ID=1118495 /ORGANISM="Dactyliosolen fragilissimus" /LENGTH=270 /DNA_ID=CAMNT_0027359381 /DNA_START=517 /DNA_END=1329 /DNA_ORIENTATION=+
MTDQFDSLRREATKLERILEDKVSRYQQLAQRLTTGTDNDTYGGNHHQRSSLLDSAEMGTLNNHHQNGSNNSSNNNNNNNSTINQEEEEESTLASDINRTISLMSDLINTKMAPAAEATGKSQHALLVKRYREILFDCSTDFKKTSAAVSRRREALELFRGATNLHGNGNGDSHRDPAMEQLLRERNAIGNSIQSANSVLGQASEIHSDLKNQGQAMRTVNGLITRIAANVPGVNHLIDSIRRKRNKDDMIVSGVVASCIVFTLWYIFVA